MKLHTIAAAAAFSFATAAAAAEDVQAEANKAFTVYPKESLAAGEQGTVRYRVKIDRKGRPSECEVTESSGFSRLDLATCTLLMERARFTPRRNGSGKASGGVHEGRVTWRLG
jgi:TonB family protein